MLYSSVKNIKEVKFKEIFKGYNTSTDDKLYSNDTNTWGFCEVKGDRPTLEDAAIYTKELPFIEQLSEIEIHAALHTTVDKLQKGIEKEFKNGGTTLAIATADKRRIYHASVGDSLIYYFIADKNGNIKDIARLNETHDLYSKEEYERVEKFRQQNPDLHSTGISASERDRRRLELGNGGDIAVTRALGDMNYEKAGLIHIAKTGKFDITKLEEGDKFYLLVCCDGLLETQTYLGRQNGVAKDVKQLEYEFISKSFTAAYKVYNGDIGKITKQLVADALQGEPGDDIGGSQDNISAHLKKLTTEDSYELLGIFDGHGGAQVANYCAKNFSEIFNKEILKSLLAREKFENISQLYLNPSIADKFLKVCEQEIKEDLINKILESMQNKHIHISVDEEHLKAAVNYLLDLIENENLSLSDYQKIMFVVLNFELDINENKLSVTEPVIAKLKKICSEIYAIFAKELAALNVNEMIHLQAEEFLTLKQQEVLVAMYSKSKVLQKIYSSGMLNFDMKVREIFTDSLIESIEQICVTLESVCLQKTCLSVDQLLEVIQEKATRRDSTNLDEVLDYIAIKIKEYNEKYTAKSELITITDLLRLDELIKSFTEISIDMQFSSVKLDELKQNWVNFLLSQMKLIHLQIDKPEWCNYFDPFKIESQCKYLELLLEYLQTIIKQYDLDFTEKNKEYFIKLNGYNEDISYFNSVKYFFAKRLNEIKTLTTPYEKAQVSAKAMPILAEALKSFEGSELKLAWIANKGILELHLLQAEIDSYSRVSITNMLKSSSLLFNKNNSDTKSSKNHRFGAEDLSNIRLRY